MDTSIDLKLRLKDKLMRLWHVINVLVGNAETVTVQGEQKRRFVHLSVIMTYLVCFVGGILLGDIYDETLINIEKGISLLSTMIVYTLGYFVISEEIKKQSWSTFSSLSLILILSQTAFAFNLVSAPVSQILIHLASIASIILIFIFDHD